MIEFFTTFGLILMGVVFMFCVFGYPLRFIITREHTWAATMLWLFGIVLLMIWSNESMNDNIRADVNGTEGDMLYAWPVLLAAFVSSLLAQIVFYVHRSKRGKRP